MVRESTTSVTHLVKIVAKEVVSDMLESGEILSPGSLFGSDGVVSRLERLEQELCIGETDTEIENTPNKWSCESAGRIWEPEQQTMLEDDLKTAIAWMARRQHRSAGSIEIWIRCILAR